MKEQDHSPAAHPKSPEDWQQIEYVVPAGSAVVVYKNFIYIEYFLLHCKKHLDQLQSPDTVGLSSMNVSLSETENLKH
ncbi:hypothetical protein NC651_039660 [Populus alba x Populus x berolinensis]|nr:hypothetical protein NC651_039660 [Populus alba x Populus x berolinensis]